MRRFAEVGAMLMGLMLMSVQVSCCCSRAPEPAFTELPPEPAPYIPPKPPPMVVTQAPVAPPPVVTEVPPAVEQQIQDLDKLYPGLFKYKDGMLLFNADTLFDSGSSLVKAQFKAALTKLAQILSGDQAKDRPVTIFGYTDTDRVVKASTIAHLKSLGKSADNQGLSEARAESVATILKAGGVDAGRIVTQGKGQSNPVADNKTPSGKAQNRRVEVYIKPLDASAGR